MGKKFGQSVFSGAVICAFRRRMELASNTPIAGMGFEAPVSFAIG